MITVSIGGKEIVVKPKHLIDYVEKVDFIRSRRTSPFDLLKDFPSDQMKGAGGAAITEIAMRTVYTNSSSVSIEEELSFDRSEEGFFWTLWKCMPPEKKAGPVTQTASSIPDWKAGINRARMLWKSGTPEEKQRLRLAIEAVDERANLKNSDSPNDQSSDSLPGQNPQPESSTPDSGR